MNNGLVAGYTLFGSGMRAWDDIANAFDGWTATWLDLDGWHVGEPMPQTPIGTAMLWAQKGGVLARMRPDGDRGVAAVLVAEGDERSRSIGDLMVAAEQVEVRRQRAIRWDANRVGNEFGGLLDTHSPIDIVLVDGLRPLSFVRLLLSE